jgi:hypothetical protein
MKREVDLTREEAIERFGEPNEMGHITRFSDSSMYDEKCVRCGMVDQAKRNIENTPCPDAQQPPPRTNPMTSDEMIELLPCPFCGSEANIVTETAAEGTAAQITSHFGRCSFYGCDVEGPYCSTIREATSKWNTRTATEAGMGELREALEQARVDILVTLGACRDSMSPDAVEVFQNIAKRLQAAALPQPPQESKDGR